MARLSHVVGRRKVYAVDGAAFTYVAAVACLLFILSFCLRPAGNEAM